MLGVLKRRWKPKRSSASRIPGCDLPPPDGANTTTTTTDKSIYRQSMRQVHPVCAAHLFGFEKEQTPSPVDIGRIEPNSSPPPYPKRASLESNSSPTQQCYPLAPNICVEAGRIQFVRQESEDAAVERGRVTITRGVQTEDEEEDIKKSLEEQIHELEMSLEALRRNELRDKQTIVKLQKQLSRRESVQRDADRERRLRADSETRTKQALQEAARCKSRLKLLTAEFTRMEETVRSLLMYKKLSEQLRQEKNALTLAFENRCQQHQNTITRLNNEIIGLRKQLAQVNSDSGNNTEEIFQAHATTVEKQAEESRRQYERCLDDVANQVVKALLAQKGLREEVGALNKKIHELEIQNEALTSMLMQQIRGEDVITMKSRSDSPDTLVKHCNSFNSEILDEVEVPDGQVVSKVERRLSTGSETFETRFSLEDKKRHQVLSKLWSEWKGAEMTPKKLLQALSAVESRLWIQPQRPMSLNLHFPIVHTTKYQRTRPLLAQSITSKSEEEPTTGMESPESGNRDEGYSTMSSDVQTEVTRISAEPNTIGNCCRSGLEDLKEATDETDTNNETRLLVADPTNCQDSDVLYIPLNILNVKPRNSFPPAKEILPFQHIMRSYSDSHLCIKITTTAPSSYYSFTSPISSSPSIFVLDITEKNGLRRTKPSALWGTQNLEFYEDRTSQISWSSSIEERMEFPPLDTEYIQHWLRLDDTRSTFRDMFELEYDRAELEDWSLSLSNEEFLNKRTELLTPGQISVSTTLPSIQEHNALELEEDSNECLWNNSSYLADREGRELVTLLMDSGGSEKAWPYAAIVSQVSPANSWSSGGSEGGGSKRSSAVMSDEGGEEVQPVGTDFTRDFYRLVKFESTKSLASTSSRSIGGAISENGDQHNQLNHITEKNEQSPTNTKEFNIEAPERTLRTEPVLTYASEVCLVTPLDQESESCSAIAEHPVDICSTKVEEGREVISSSAIENISRIPRRKQNSRISLSPKKSLDVNVLRETKIPKSKLVHKKRKRDGVVSELIDGPPHRAVSFHERVTSKDVIEELNRMIKNGEEGVEQELVNGSTKLDQGCKVTGWVHIEKDVDLTDPKARANLLDVMMASVSSDSSPTSSCGNSVASDVIDEPSPNYGHLHRLHRFHRQKKANAVRPELAVVRASSMSSVRPSIVGRSDFFVRYGEKEMEAVASFDFLDELSSTGSSSLGGEEGSGIG